MKLIKFRGTTSGGYKTYGDYRYIACYGTAKVNDIVVEPESVAQLVGYDPQGREVYEGDEVIIDGKTYIATLKPSFEEK